MFRLALVLVLAGAAASAAAEDGAVTLVDATVVASPGAPAGLRTFLPGGTTPGTLSLPLPKGPILVLGLPDEDVNAYALALRWNLLPPDGDLHGGYVTAAWHDGHRPIAVILAADPAALHAARFELEAVPASPPQATAVRVRGPWRHERAEFPSRVLEAREEFFLRLLPRTSDDPRVFLRSSAEVLERKAEAASGAAPWVAPLAARIRRESRHLRDPVVLVPRAPAAIRVDGWLSEPAWAFAAHVPVRVVGGLTVEVLAIADGRELAVASRDRALPAHDLRIGPADGEAGGEPSAPTETFARIGHGSASEGRFTHHDLSGDAHPTRVFALWLHGRRVATLVLGP